MQLVNGDQLEGNAVEDERGEWAEVLPRVGAVDMVNRQGKESVSEHPAMKMPVGHVGHFFLLGVDRHVLI